MNRRQFLATALAAPLACGFTPPLQADSTPPPPPQADPATSPPPESDDTVPSLPKWRRFEIITEITLPDVDGPAQLWTPVFQSVGGYQSSALLDEGTSGGSDFVYDARYGAPMLRTIWEKRGLVPCHALIRQYVDVREAHCEPMSERGTETPSRTTPPLTDDERRLWTAPTATMPLDGVVLATAARITAGIDNKLSRLEAIYNWVIDHAHYDPDVPGCGRGDIRGLLERPKLSGKCVDLNGLFVGLARAAGFPAREVYGLRVAPSRWFPCLGAHGSDLARAQHCRAEVYLDWLGWLPVDPSDVVKAATVERLPRDDAKLVELREYLFGNWEGNWIGYNSATDLELPGEDGKTYRPEFPFLMYPHALMADGPRPCTDPRQFQYEITARPLPFG